MESLILHDIINENLIKLSLEGLTRDEVIYELTDLLYQNGIISSKEIFVKEVKKRENLCTTGIGMGIAIPHGKCSCVIKPAVAFGRSTLGISWDTMDGNPVHMVFLLAVSESGAGNQHLQLLAMLSRKLMHDDFRKGLMAAKDKTQLLSMFKSIFRKS
ncbi:fructose PTS transporter subunit IIA [Thermovorax subterraneus]|nr:fructose PTS transporter subunit IIA [Thermovorax subterraneus]